MSLNQTTASAAQDATVANLTRANIKARMAALNERDRALTERLAALFQAGKVGDVQTVTDRERRLHKLAKANLNGAGGLLPPIPENESEGDVLLEREAVRLALSVLRKADFEAEAIEAAQRATALRPKFLNLQREWLIAAAHFEAVAKNVRQFREEIGGLVREALDTHLPLDFAAIEFPTNFYSPYQSIDDHINEAIKIGLVSKAEIAQARKVSR